MQMKLSFIFSNEVGRLTLEDQLIVWKINCEIKSYCFTTNYLKPTVLHKVCNIRYDLLKIIESSRV